MFGDTLAGHLHGPVPQGQGGGVPVQSGPDVGVDAPHGQDVTQPGGRGQHQQPEAEEDGDRGADEDPDVVEGPLGEFPGQRAAPCHGGPVGTDGDDVVEEEARAREEEHREDGRGDSARGPEAPLAAALSLELVP